MLSKSFVEKIVVPPSVVTELMKAMANDNAKNVQLDGKNRTVWIIRRLKFDWDRVCAQKTNWSYVRRSECGRSFLWAFKLGIICIWDWNMWRSQSNHKQSVSLFDRGTIADRGRKRSIDVNVMKRTIFSIKRTIFSVFCVCCGGNYRATIGKNYVHLIW